MAKRIYSIDKFLGRKGLLRLCENLAAKMAYKIYQNGCTFWNLDFTRSSHSFFEAHSPKQALCPM